jgi:FAD/FMN-containing dehydrogenase
MTSTNQAHIWTNWAGNQQFAAQEIIRPASEDELIDAVRRAVREGKPVGTAGSAHSFTPIVQTSGLLVEMKGVNGTLSHLDQRAEVLAGTTLHQLGQELWDRGLSMKNQGDVDAQTLAGAISTGTHGSGIRYGTLSSTVRGMRLLAGTGEIIDIDGSQPELLYAAQVSMGLLGVITRLSLDTAPAYRLRESNRMEPVEDVLERWDEAVPQYRHYSLFWAPTEDSAALYDLPYIPPDHCYVKMLDELPVESDQDRLDPPSGPVGGRTGPAYLIYPDTTSEFASWIELEYMVDAKDGKSAFLALRKLMQEKFPDAISPIQVRWTKGEKAFLSPHYGHDTCSLSVSGLKTYDWDRFLRAVDQTLRPWKPRPHWGKMGYMDREGFRATYPELDRFLSVRGELDPLGLFLNDYFRDVLGL